MALRDPDQVLSEVLTVRVSADLKTALEVIAKDDDRTVSYVVERILSDVIDGELDSDPKFSASVNEAKGKRTKPPTAKGRK